MLEWMEREHQIEDMKAKNDANTILSLCECGLMQLFMVPRMRGNIQLLQHVVGMWDLDECYFQVGVHVLTFEVEDIYFITISSRWGENISLSKARGGEEMAYSRINQYCTPGTHKVRRNIPIKKLRDITLRTIIFTIARFLGSKSPHHVTKS